MTTCFVCNYFSYLCSLWKGWNQEVPVHSPIRTGSHHDATAAQGHSWIRRVAGGGVCHQPLRFQTLQVIRSSVWDFTCGSEAKPRSQTCCVISVIVRAAVVSGSQIIVSDKQPPFQNSRTVTGLIGSLLEETQTLHSFLRHRLVGAGRKCLKRHMCQ